MPTFEVGDRVWVDIGEACLTSLGVVEIADGTLHLEDWVEAPGGYMLKKTATANFNEAWHTREEAIRAGAAHPNDWFVTANDQKYWDAYYEGQRERDE